MAIYTPHLNRSCTSILIQRHHATYGATGACHGLGNQSLSFHWKGQSSIADRSMWISGGQMAVGYVAPRVLQRSSFSIALPLPHTHTSSMYHQHHKILPTRSVFRQHTKKPATSQITPSSENMDGALDNIFLNMLKHRYKVKHSWSVELSNTVQCVS